MSGHGFPDHIDSKGRGHWIEPKSTTRLCRRCQMLFRADVRDSLRTCAGCRPVHRVPAWRVPNEDGAAVGVRYARLVAQYPVRPWNLGEVWDTCTAPSDDGSRRVILERERMAKVDADLRAEGFGRVDPARRPWLGWCLK
jgi:hypothetical protein